MLSLEINHMNVDRCVAHHHHWRWWCPIVAVHCPFVQSNGKRPNGIYRGGGADLTVAPRHDYRPMQQCMISWNCNQKFMLTASAITLIEYRPNAATIMMKNSSARTFCRMREYAISNRKLPTDINHSGFEFSNETQTTTGRFTTEQRCNVWSGLSM